MKGHPSVNIKRGIQRFRGEELSVFRLFQIDELINNWS